MSMSSGNGSPRSDIFHNYHYNMHDNFSIDLPSPSLTASSQGTMKTPSMLSPPEKRSLTFARDGILGAQKVRKLSRTSSDRDVMQYRKAPSNNKKSSDSDDGFSSLKRKTPESGIDYPRRRATIAVGTLDPHV
jgi:hypothetical protein